MSTDDVNDALGTEIHSDDYDSLGGIIIEKLDRFPENGESVVLDNGIKLTVRGIDQNRIERIEVTLPEPESGAVMHPLQPDRPGGLHQHSQRQPIQEGRAKLSLYGGENEGIVGSCPFV